MEPSASRTVTDGRDAPTASGGPDDAAEFADFFVSEPHAASNTTMATLASIRLQRTVTGRRPHER